MKQNTYIVIAVVIIIAVAGGYYFMQKNQQSTQQNMMQPAQNKMQGDMNQGKMDENKGGEMSNDGDTHTLTWADNGKHMYLEPTDKLQLSLDDGTGAKWTVTLSDPTVFSDESNGTLPAHIVGIYEAQKFGEETFTATNNMTGANAKMFKLVIRVVKSDEDPNLPAF